ncbi:MAG: hypothetical protein AAF802_10575, partial [Planctomycetota bacterium]
LPRAMFELLSFEQQADLERVARKALAKVDVKGLEQTIRPIHSIGDLIVTRQRWLFSHPKLSGFAEEEMEDMKKGLLLTGGLIRDTLSEETLQLSSFSQVPLRDWVANFDDNFSPYFVALLNESEARGELTFGDFDVLDEKDGVATVRLFIESDGFPWQPEVKFHEVNGQWKFLIDGWDEVVRKAEEQLDTVPDGQMLAGMQGQVVSFVVSPFVQPAFAAQSASELHEVMDGWIQQVAPMIAQFTPPPTRPGGMGMGMGMDDYGDMSESDYYGGMPEGMDSGMGMGPGGPSRPPASMSRGGIGARPPGLQGGGPEAGGLSTGMQQGGPVGGK